MADLVGSPTDPVNVTMPDINADGTTPASPTEMNSRYQQLLDNDARLEQDVASVQQDVQEFTNIGSAPWNKPSSGAIAVIEVWGGGGGGGGGTGGGNAEYGGGGGGGGYAKRIMPLSELGSLEAVTVGAGGAGLVGATGFAGAGGDSSFGTHVTATGGGGGGGGNETDQATRAGNGGGFRGGLSGQEDDQNARSVWGGAAGGTGAPSASIGMAARQLWEVLVERPATGPVAHPRPASVGATAALAARLRHRRPQALRPGVEVAARAVSPPTTVPTALAAAYASPSSKPSGSD